MWKRAGQSAQVVGLDWPAALALIPDGADREAVVAALKAYEIGMLEGTAERIEDENARREAQDQ